jgi:hypothetical protein
MKTIALILSLAALAFAGAANAQQYLQVNAYTQGTNAIAANATVTPNVVVPVTKHSAIGLQVSTSSSAGAAGNVVTSFQRSVDGVTWETTPSVTMTNAVSGNSTVTAVTNITTGGVGFLRLNTIASSANGSLTNTAVQVTRKAGF